jgi:hypothetical protein
MQHRLKERQYTMPAAHKAQNSTAENEKLRELILYISQSSEADPCFSYVKLNQLLFFSDFIAYLYLGRSVTGQEYQTLPQGPAPRVMLPVLNQMTEDHILVIREDEYCGRTQRRPIALRKPALNDFNGEEIALVDKQLHRYWKMSAAQISDYVHQFIGWEIMKQGETIPYQMALLGRRPLTEQERQWALELEPKAREILSYHAANA